MKNIWFKSTILAGAAAGAGYATWVGMAAWDHNPQGEFHDWQTGAVQWDAFGPLIGLAFAIPFILTSLTGAVLWAAAILIRKYSS